MPSYPTAHTSLEAVLLTHGQPPRRKDEKEEVARERYITYYFPKTLGVNL